MYTSEALPGHQRLAHELFAPYAEELASVPPDLPLHDDFLAHPGMVRFPAGLYQVPPDVLLASGQPLVTGRHNLAAVFAMAAYVNAAEGFDHDKDPTTACLAAATAALRGAQAGMHPDGTRDWLKLAESQAAQARRPDTRRAGVIAQVAAGQVALIEATRSNAGWDDKRQRKIIQMESELAATDDDLSLEHFLAADWDPMAARLPAVRALLNHVVGHAGMAVTLATRARWRIARPNTNLRLYTAYPFNRLVLPDDHDTYARQQREFCTSALRVALRYPSGRHYRQFQPSHRARLYNMVADPPPPAID